MPFSGVLKKIILITAAGLLPLLSSLLTACSSQSVLINTNDPTFDHAQLRLQKTKDLLDTMKLNPDEYSLFFQAESFYRYRFQPPPQNSASFFTELAAAATDLPALQSLAGSLSLQEVRVRSYDSAIQLWETLLKKSPETPLKPLILYRLGWAYRNEATVGLPRNSPDEPLDELIQLDSSSQLAKLAQETKKNPWKSKKIAETRSLIPGLGQIYVGDTKGGIIRMSVAAVALAAIVIPIAQASQRGSDLTWDHDWPLLAISLSGLIALSFDYTSSYEDAMKGVVLYNEKSELDFEQQHPDAP